MSLLDRLDLATRRAGAGLWKTAPAAAFCAIAAIVLYRIDDTRPKPNSPSLSTAIALYFVAWLVSGTLLGVLYPLARSRIAQALVSMPIGLPVGYFVMLFSRDADPTALDRTDYIIAIVLGAAVGLFVWAYTHTTRQSD